MSLQECVLGAPVCTYLLYALSVELAMELQIMNLETKDNYVMLNK